MPNINPNYAECTSQKDMIWKALQAGEKLTMLKALRLFGCGRLPNRICELRKEGKRIHGEKILIIGKNKKKKYVNQYWI